MRELVQECGVDACTANKQGDTPVIVALKNSHWDTASSLVTELGADVRAYNHAVDSCLHHAAVAPSETKQAEEQAEEQVIKVAGVMMDRWGIELLSQADFHSGLTPLDCAVYVGKEANMQRQRFRCLMTARGWTATQMLHTHTSTLRWWMLRMLRLRSRASTLARIIRQSTTTKPSMAPTARLHLLIILCPPQKANWSTWTTTDETDVIQIPFAG